MNKLFLGGLISALLLSSSACEQVFFEPAPETGNLAVFDEFSKVFGEKYAMFDYKGVDWVSLSQDVRATITDATTPAELGEKMGDMVIALRDGHSVFITPDSTYGFDLEAGFPLNFAFGITEPFALSETTQLSQAAAYHLLPGNIGYILIISFEGITNDDINSLMDVVKDTDGLIIDVRINGGGDPSVAANIAQRLTRERYSGGTEFFKTGPGANDFSGSEVFVNPVEEGITYLDKKVAILQDRLSYSATSTLIYLTDPNPNVATFGGFSGGGTGSVASGYLSNGWQYNLSVSDFVDAQGRRLDDGVAPDFSVALDPTNETQDEIILAAIDWINN